MTGLKSTVLLPCGTEATEKVVAARQVMRDQRVHNADRTAWTSVRPHSHQNYLLEWKERVQLSGFGVSRQLIGHWALPWLISHVRVTYQDEPETGFPESV